MSQQPPVNKEIAENVSEADKKEICEKYQRIESFETRFNNNEKEIKKLASIWLLADLGAIAFLVKGTYLGLESSVGNASANIIDARLLISLVGLMGIIGLFILWILDQIVYQGLLNSVFLYGLRLEYCYNFLPPMRTLMMIFSNKRGMVWYLRFYYILPMSFLTAIALISSFWYVNETKNMPSITIGLVSLVITIWVYWKSARLEKYAEIAKGFNDKEFVDYLTKGKFETILQRH